MSLEEERGAGSDMSVVTSAPIRGVGGPAVREGRIDGRTTFICEKPPAFFSQFAAIAQIPGLANR
jgi:hypothetical protein